MMRSGACVALSIVFAFGCTDRRGSPPADAGAADVPPCNEPVAVSDQLILGGSVTRATPYGDVDVAALWIDGERRLLGDIDRGPSTVTALWWSAPTWTVSGWQEDPGEIGPSTEQHGRIWYLDGSPDEEVIHPGGGSITDMAWDVGGLWHVVGWSDSGDGDRAIYYSYERNWTAYPPATRSAGRSVRARHVTTFAGRSYTSLHEAIPTARIWIDGMETVDLPFVNWGYVDSMTAGPDAVYIAGRDDDELVYFRGQDSTFVRTATGIRGNLFTVHISVTGDTITIGYTFGIGDFEPKIWQAPSDGSSPATISDLEVPHCGIVNGILATDEHVYAVGSSSYDTTCRTCPTYWIDGVAHHLHVDAAAGDVGAHLETIAVEPR
jgi:hypothetical protein